jgi:hypothetical protein
MVFWDNDLPIAFVWKITEGLPSLISNGNFLKSLIGMPDGKEEVPK